MLVVNAMDLEVQAHGIGAKEKACQRDVCKRKTLKVTCFRR